MRRGGLEKDREEGRMSRDEESRRWGEEGQEGGS